MSANVGPFQFKRNEAGHYTVNKHGEAVARIRKSPSAGSYLPFTHWILETLASGRIDRFEAYSDARESALKL
ncbi:hypothetical protein VRRI112168_00070 [Vreelandella rituensis]|uniref:Uncharacterized protein n=1 Tax=Vreelandella rituensis TaxID=2282306 RepID=A0A368UB37_9GAMM|nr:hypothetical protein [Halomonas rituensis]RCV93906.1 hypothetical protein DU506_01735 [Halomonas rituensis]